MDDFVWLDLRCAELDHTSGHAAGAEWRGAAERDDEWRATRRAHLLSDRLHGSRSLVGPRHESDLGTEETVEAQVSRLLGWRLAAQNQNHAPSERGAGSRRDARVVGLHAAAGDERVGADARRFRRQQLRLAHFVAASPERQEVVAFDENARRPGSERALQPFEPID